MHCSRTSLLVAAIGLVACGDSDRLGFDAGTDDTAVDAAEQTADELDAQLDAGQADDAGDGMREVSIRFKAKLGSEELSCGRQYPNLGATGVSATPQDFRFYVQEVRLVRTDGSEQKVELTLKPPFQRGDVALIDFTNATGACGGSGGSVVNTTLTGKVPEGDYEGIVFVNGVPEELNHAGPAETAQPPLDDVTLFWSWLSGYRFIVAELLPAATHDGGAADGGAHGDAAPHSAGNEDAAVHGGDGGIALHGNDAGADGGMHGGGGGHAVSQAAFVHIGSSACGGTQSTAFSCARKARNQIRLMNFDPDQSVVVADLAEVFKETDLKNPVQCHGIAAPCAAPYAALGIDMDTGEQTSTQRVFRVE